MMLGQGDGAFTAGSVGERHSSGFRVKVSWAFMCCVTFFSKVKRAKQQTLSHSLFPQHAWISLVDVLNNVCAWEVSTGN